MYFESNTAVEAYLEQNPDLTSLMIHESPNVTRLPDLPDSLTALYLYDCDGLVCLPAFPQSLAHLVVSGCRSLSNMPDLAESLKSLVVDECPRLIVPDLPGGLRHLSLEMRGARGGLWRVPKILHEAKEPDDSLVDWLVITSNLNEEDPAS